MRVLYSFAQQLDGPATATTALRQILGLHDLGVELTVYCTGLGDVELPDGIRVRQTRRPGPRAKMRIPRRAISAQRFLPVHDAIVSRHLRHHRGRYDLVHTWPRASLRTMQSARAVDVRAVRESPNEHTADGFAASCDACANIGVSLPYGHSHRFDPVVLAREEKEYAAASAVLVPSKFAEESFLRRGFAPQRLLRHSYGCDIVRFSPDPRPRDRLSPLRAAFIGRGDPTKGLHIALAAWRRSGLAEVGHLDVCGTLLPDYASALREDLALSSVHVRGFVPDVATVQREADVLLLPSWTEGSALVTIEAQASGCVPLVSDASGQLGVPGETSLVHQRGDVAELARQLTLVNSDRMMLSRLRANCIAMREELSWTAAARRLLAAYEAALDLPD